MASGATRALDRLPERFAAAIVEFMFGPLRENPRRVGRELRRELRGLMVARRGVYRIVYELDEDRRQIRILDIDHRSDVYRPR
jgi:mRNA-degrading endonuclease RelE of RelBE toxin-antitoxin system